MYTHNAKNTHNYHYTNQDNNGYLPTNVWDFLDTSVTQHIRLLKDTTGCGATYGAMLKQTIYKKFIVMPGRTLIKNKQKQADAGAFDPHTTISLKSGSKYNTDHIPAADNILLTPDQLVKIYEEQPHIWNEIRNEILIIDEEHTAETHGVYREAYRKLAIIIKEWTGHIATITATRPFTVSPFMETFDVVQLINDDAPTQEVLVTDDVLTFWEKLHEYHTAGEPIILVTNDIKKYVRVHNIDSNIYTITGEKLAINLEAEGIKTKTPFYKTKNLIVLSSSAMEGIDLPVKSHVMVLSEFKNDHTTFSLQSSIQALGRARKGMLESIICVVRPKAEIEVPNRKSEIEDVRHSLDHAILKYTRTSQLLNRVKKIPNVIVIADQPHVDEQQIDAEIAKSINNNLFYADDWAAQCNEILKFNHIHLSYLQKLVPIRPVMQGRADFKTKVQHFLAMTFEERAKMLHESVLNMSGGKHRGTSPTTAVALIVADTIKTINDTEIISSLARCGEVGRALKILNSIAVATSPYASTKNKSNNAIGHCCSAYGHLKPKTGSLYSKRTVEIIQTLFYMTNKSQTRALAKAEVIRKDKKHDETHNEKRYIELLTEAAAFILNKCEQSRQSIHKGRQYGPHTSLSMTLLCNAYPYSVLEIDVISANPRFIDTIYGSNLVDDVYTNVMNIYNVDRNEAKTIYNAKLNQTQNQEARRSFFIKVGYTATQADRIISDTTPKDDYEDTTGKMHDIMAEAEEEMITHLAGYFDYHNVTRRHDSLVMFGQLDELEEQQKIFTDLNDRRFHYELI